MCPEILRSNAELTFVVEKTPHRRDLLDITFNFPGVNTKSPSCRTTVSLNNFGFDIFNRVNRYTSSYANGEISLVKACNYEYRMPAAIDIQNKNVISSFVFILMIGTLKRLFYSIQNALES